MSTITQRLRDIADTTEQYSDRHSRWVADNLRAIAAELEAPVADAVPVVAMDANEWAELYRLREAVKGPAGYETWQDAATAERRQRVLVERDHLATVAALQAALTSEREHASKLRETFLRMQQEQVNTAKPLDDPRLQELFGCAIDGALTIGYQGGAAAANGHWLKPWWENGRAVAEREAALQARIIDLEAGGVDRELMRAAISARDARIADMEARINALEAQLLNHANGLYARIAHGDAEHRAWLRTELDAFFFADSSTMRSENARINALEARQECDSGMAAIESGMAAIESALDELVNRCNADSFLATDDAVIRAEAALERLYIARRLASSPPQQDSSKERP